MTSKKRRRQKGRASTDAHVRIYRQEMRTPAWQTLSPNARALLIELRSLYVPHTGNIVFLSVREAMVRLCISQRPVEAAFKELIERGWIHVHEPGGFNRKTRHATSYRLANEKNELTGSAATKEFMRWRPAEQQAA